MALPNVGQDWSMQDRDEKVLFRRRDLTSMCRSQGVSVGVALSNIAFALRVGVISEVQAARCLDRVLGSKEHKHSEV